MRGCLVVVPPLPSPLPPLDDRAGFVSDRVPAFAVSPPPLPPEPVAVRGEGLGSTAASSADPAAAIASSSAASSAGGCAASEARLERTRFGLSAASELELLLAPPVPASLLSVAPTIASIKSAF